MFLRTSAVASAAYALLLSACGQPSNSRVTGSSNEIINIWRISSPNALGSLPDTGSIARAAAKAGLSVRVLPIPVKGFSESYFRAVDRHEEPEVLVTEYPLGEFAGIASREDISSNLIQLPFETFQAPSFLVVSARGLAVSKSLVQPECGVEWTGLKPFGDGLKGAAEAAVKAYLTGGAVAEDPDRLRTPRPDGVAAPGLQIRAALCGYWGNERLAFVPLAAAFEKDRPRERQPAIYSPLFRSIESRIVTLIFRGDQGAWKLLAAATDPVSTDTFLSGMHDLQNSLNQTRASAAMPSAATLLSPADGDFPEPAAGARFGDFTWKPSLSEDAVAEIIEFAYDDDARCFLRFRTKHNQSEGRVSSGHLWTTNREWKWRVWTISPSGAVSFSKSRSFRH